MTESSLFDTHETSLSSIFENMLWHVPRNKPNPVPIYSDNRYPSGVNSPPYPFIGLIKPEYWNEMGIKVKQIIDDDKRAKKEHTTSYPEMTYTVKSVQSITLPTLQTFTLHPINLERCSLKIVRNVGCADNLLNKKNIDSIMALNVSLDCGCNSLQKMSLGMNLFLCSLFGKKITTSVDCLDIPLCFFDMMCGNIRGFPNYMLNCDSNISLYGLDQQKYVATLHYNGTTPSDMNEMKLLVRHMDTYELKNYDAEYIVDKGIQLKFAYLAKALIVRFKDVNDVSILSKVYLDDRSLDFHTFYDHMTNLFTVMIPLCPGIDHINDLGDLIQCEKQTGLGVNGFYLPDNYLRFEFREEDKETIQPEKITYEMCALTHNIYCFTGGLVGSCYIY